MKLGICIHSNDPETVWNAFRFASYSIKHFQDEVRVFLLGKGVEAETLSNDSFNVKDQMQAFVSAGGSIKACGTCLKLRQSEGSEVCPISTMGDLHQLVAECDKVLTF